MESDFLPRDKKLNPYSRILRNNATKQENHIWYDFLRNQSVRFYRQRIIGEYIADFYCHTIKLVIEIDGSQHYEEAGMKSDERRTAYLESLGLTVMRFTNSDVDNNFEGVCISIEQMILNRLSVIAPG